MAKIKDSSVLNVDLTSSTTEYNANKKTALNITDYTGWSFTTDDAKTLKITKNTKTVTITNASKLKYIKTTTESDYSDLIAMGLIDYTGTITGKNNKYTGTIYNDQLRVVNLKTQSTETAVTIQSTAVEMTTKSQAEQVQTPFFYIQRKNSVMIRLP